MCETIAAATLVVYVSIWCMFLQKYVEQISRLAGLCQQDSTAAAELETLVSMRVRHPASAIHTLLLAKICRIATQPL